MKRASALMLGILSATGGFLDIGDIVANTAVGARYGLRLAWVTGLGVVGVCAYAEMSGRLVAMSGRPVFDVVRERLGPRAALVNLVSSFSATLLSLTAQIGGLALVIQLASGIPHLVWVVPVGVGLWLVVWRVRFHSIQQVLGTSGLAVAAVGLSLWWLDPDWSALAAQARTVGPQAGEPIPTYFFYAILIYAAAMTPYEVFFFSSGGVEERWKPKDLGLQKANAFLGFPLGGLLSLGIAAAAATVLLPLGLDVHTLGQAILPVGLAFGLAGVAVVLFGFFAVISGSALETGMSLGYMLAQYFGWSWGKRVAPKKAARFHVAVGAALLVATLVVQTGVDPVLLTELALVASAAALPLTYLPVLIVANDRQYLGDRVNGRVSNAIGLVTLAAVIIAAIAAFPLALMTGMGA